MYKLYTTLYSFMAVELGLKGLTKEVFAIIFGFWLETNKTAVWVSLSTMQSITGGTRPAIVKAIKVLEKKGFLRTTRSPGKRSLYSITIPRAIIDDFEATFHLQGKPVNRTPVKPSNHQGLNSNTGRSIFFLQQNNNKSNHGNQSIEIATRAEFDSADKF